MTTILDPALSSLSDDQLLRSVETLACRERHAMAQLIAALVELDRRKLFLGQGYPPCSPTARRCSTYRARGVRSDRGRSIRAPVSVVSTSEKRDRDAHDDLLAGASPDGYNHRLAAAARHKSRREVEQLVAMTRPKADAPAVVRKLPSSGPPDASETPALIEYAPPSPSPSLQAEREPDRSVAERSPVDPAHARLW